MEKKISIEDFAIEVTRKCNMSCPHCLRGEAEDMDADMDLIPKLFDGVSSIGTLIFTGGEPSLNTPFITKVVDYVLDNDIEVNGCFITTNGKVYSQKLVDSVRRLFFRYMEKQTKGRVNPGLTKYILSEGMFGIAVSLDTFHEDIPLDNYLKYATCGFYSDSKEVDFKTHKAWVVRRGRGDSVEGSQCRDLRSFHSEEVDEETIVVDMVYITADGDVFSDCDMSYDMMYTGAYGNVFDETLAEILNDAIEDRKER